MTNPAAFTFRWPRMEKPYSPPNANTSVSWRVAADTPAQIAVEISHRRLRPVRGAESDAGLDYERYPHPFEPCTNENR